MGDADLQSPEKCPLDEMEITDGPFGVKVDEETEDDEEDRDQLQRDSEVQSQPAVSAHMEELTMALDRELATNQQLRQEIIKVKKTVLR